MYKVLRTSLLSLALIFVMAGTAFAQTKDQPDYCANLDEDLCALMVASNDAMAAVTSGTSDLSFEIEMTNIPDAPFSEIAFSYSQESAFILDESALALINETREMDLFERQRMFMTRGALGKFLSQLLSGTTSDVSLTLNFSDELAALLAQETELPIPGELNLSFMLIDGVFYVNVADLGALVPELAFFQGWVGLEILPLIETELEGAVLQGLSDEEMMAVAQSMASANFGVAGPFITMLNSFGAPVNIAEFFNTERLEDATIGNEGVAVIRTTVDYEALFASQFFADIMRQQLQQQAAQQGQQLSKADIDEIIQVSRVFGPVLLEDLNFSIVEGIGIESGYLYTTEATLDWDLSNTAALASTMGGGSSDLPEELPYIYMNSVTSNADFNDDIEIVAPAGAFVVPLEMLMTLIAQ